MTDPEPITGTISATLRTIAANIDMAERRGETPDGRYVSPVEIRLLEALQAVNIHPVQQHPIGRYSLDFYFPDANLCVEVDGKQHALRRDSDHRRDQHLREVGINTVRIPARLILIDADRVALTISDILDLAAIRKLKDAQ